MADRRNLLCLSRRSPSSPCIHIRRGPNPDQSCKEMIQVSTTEQEPSALALRRSSRCRHFRPYPYALRAISCLSLTKRSSLAETTTPRRQPTISRCLRCPPAPARLHRSKRLLKRAFPAHPVPQSTHPRQTAGLEVASGQPLSVESGPIRLSFGAEADAVQSWPWPSHTPFARCVCCRLSTMPCCTVMGWRQDWEYERKPEGRASS